MYLRQLNTLKHCALLRNTSCSLICQCDKNVKTFSFWNLPNYLIWMFNLKILFQKRKQFVDVWSIDSFGEFYPKSIPIHVCKKSWVTLKLRDTTVNQDSPFHYMTCWDTLIFLKKLTANQRTAKTKQNQSKCSNCTMGLLCKETKHKRETWNM